MNSCSGSGSAAVVSNCYQLAWILAVSRVASEDFILETVMGSYSRRLDSLELNPYVDLRQITKLTIHPTQLQKKKQSWVPQNKIMTQ